MPSASHDDVQERNRSLHAAVAKTLTQGLALYFSRPVRLFRPSKVSGWTLLRSLAYKEGATLSPTYLTSLVTRHGVFVIPRYFLPPLALNAFLGSVLWTSYSEASILLEKSSAIHPIAVAALSGAFAGGTQALVGAPAENVRLVLEGDFAHSGWSGAWKHVFLGTQPDRETVPRKQAIQEARQVREWMKEVGEMAGRGWKGWAWGFAKDVCGFAVFFSMFDITRRSANRAQRSFRETKLFSSMPQSVASHFPRIFHGIWLVCGGVLAGYAYELICRPWDVARKIVHHHELGIPQGSSAEGNGTAIKAVLNHIRLEGPVSFFRRPVVIHEPNPASINRQSLYLVLRTLSRLGPWGVGFLVWEAFGPGLAT